MIVPSYVVIGARDIAGRFIAKAVTLPAEVEGSLDIHAGLLLSEVVRRAPRDTGRYAASWHIERNGNQRIVGSGEPYGRRLEFGYSDIDSLGRLYDQAPQPHVRPAADAVEALYVKDMLIVATRRL